MKALKLVVLLLVWVTLLPVAVAGDARPNQPEERYEPGADFSEWMESSEGQKASLAQMRQRCDGVVDAEQNLNCSVSVIGRMFEAKAANQLPDYYLAIQGKHARAIATNPELNLLFSMFGNESLATLRASGDFSVSRAPRPEVLTIHPHASDALLAGEQLPYIDVSAANGHTARFVLDTGAPQSRINYDTAKLMGIRLLTDSRYAYSTFYGESDLPARLGIVDALKVGTSEFRNVLVFVSDRDNLLGLDLISKLGRLKITRKTLELNPAPPARCDSPVGFTRQDINQRLTIAARLDNRATQAIVDTGNVDYLTSAFPGDQFADASSPNPGDSPIFAARKRRYQSFKGVLKLPGTTLVTTYKYYPGFTLPPAWMLGHYVPSILLGWRAFNDFELNLDIDAARSCFNKAE